MDFWDIKEETEYLEALELYRKNKGFNKASSGSTVEYKSSGLPEFDSPDQEKEYEEDFALNGQT